MRRIAAPAINTNTKPMHHIGKFQACQETQKKPTLPNTGEQVVLLAYSGLSRSYMRRSQQFAHQSQRPGIGFPRLCLPRAIGEHLLPLIWLH
jgi:hypothetical protein